MECSTLNIEERRRKSLGNIEVYVKDPVDRDVEIWAVVPSDEKR